MLPGPVFQVELLTLARRRRYYALRFVYGLLLLYLFAVNAPDLRPSGGGNVSIQQMARIGSSLFETFAFTQALVILILTPALVAGVVADERQRKTLGDLLTSGLTSGEIVIGKLAARMVSVGVFLAVGLPVLSLLNFFGGVDPNLVVLFFAACASTAFLISAAAVVISVHARRPREAVTVTYLGELAWLFGPSLAAGLVAWSGRFRGPLLVWVNPAIEFLGSSSPFFVFLNLILGGPTSQPIYEKVLWLIGIQIVFGVALAAVAVVRLRPVQRAEAGGGRGWFGRPKSRRRWRLLPRPECRDDPVFWKELHVARGGRLARGAGAVVFLGVVALLGYWTNLFVAPAVSSIAAKGFWVAAETDGGQRGLNEYLRFVMTIVSACWAIALASAGSSSLTSEREEDTWLSLIATPLTPGEIIRGKVVGAFWSTRGIALVWSALLATGLLLGAVHPVGGLACLAANAAQLAFACALGTVFSLRSRNSGRSLVATISVLITCNGLYLLPFVGMRFESPIPLFGVTPFINAAALMSYPDMRSVFHGNGVSSKLHGVEFALTYCLSLLAYAGAGVAMTYYLIVGFDDAIDRPRTVGGRGPKRSGKGPRVEKGRDDEV